MNLQIFIVLLELSLNCVKVPFAKGKGNLIRKVTLEKKIIETSYSV